MRPDPKHFMHPNDLKAMQALKAIPGFDAIGRAFMKTFNERQFRILNMSGRIRLSAEQMPEVYSLLPPICEKLGIAEPELYLELNRSPNAYTYGDSNVFIVITSGALEYMDMDDLRTILAHECGHIACHHTLYRTIGQIILTGGSLASQIPGLSQALQIAFSYWMRCSEFSADRAAAYVCGGSEPVVRVMVRLAGAGKPIPYQVNTDLFVKQAEAYRSYVEGSAWNKTLENLIMAGQSHPLTAVRALEIRDWCSSDAFRAIDDEPEDPISRPVRPIKRDIQCPYCHATIPSRSAYCPKCGCRLWQM